MSGLPPRINYHGRTPYQNYLCRTVMHTPHRCGGGGLNVTYNFNGGSICGGGFLGGFLGGIGMSIGSMLGGLFGFGGGGWGCGSGFFPMSNFWSSPSLSWNCNPLLNLFSKKNKTEKSDKSDGKGAVENAEPKTKTVTEKCEDPDLKVINDLDDEVYKLENKADRTQAEIDALKQKIAAAKAASDDHHVEQNNKSFDDLSRRLKKLSPAEVKPAEVTQQQEIKPEEPKSKNITEKDIEELDPKEIVGITDPSIAIDILKNAKPSRISADGNSVKIPRTYNELLLAKKSGLKIQFCKNTGLSGDRQSQTIEGTIVGDIKPVKDSNSTYQILVQDKCGKYPLTLAFNSDKTGTITLGRAENAGIMYNGKKISLAKQRDKVSYEINSEKDDGYATRTSNDAAMYNDSKKAKKAK